MIDRRTYIGGTASSIILGYDPYSNWADLFDYMTGRRDSDFDPTNLHLDRGNTMEPIVIDLLRQAHHLPINTPEHFAKFDNGGADPNQIFLLEKRPLGLVGGHMDCMSDSTVFEIKCPAMRNLSMYASNGTPRKYFIQLQNYMRITGHKYGEVVLFDYDKWAVRRIKIEADPAIHAEMEERYDNFLWHVHHDKRPHPTAVERLGWHTEIESAVLDHALRMHTVMKDRRYASEEAQKEWKHRILDHLGNTTQAVTEGYQVSVSDRTRKSFDVVRGEKVSNYKVLTIKERLPVKSE